MVKRGHMVELKNISVSPVKWEKPLEVFEEAYNLELSYRDHLEKLTSLANSEGDVLTALKVASLLDAQVESCAEYEVIVNKAKAYSAMQGLLYHLDHELKKKAK